MYVLGMRFYKQNLEQRDTKRIERGLIQQDHLWLEFGNSKARCPDSMPKFLCIYTFILKYSSKWNTHVSLQTRNYWIRSYSPNALVKFLQKIEPGIKEYGEIRVHGAASS